MSLLLNNHVEYFIVSTCMQAQNIHAICRRFAELYLFIYFTIAGHDLTCINNLAEHVGDLYRYFLINSCTQISLEAKCTLVRVRDKLNIAARYSDLLNAFSGNMQCQGI